MQVAKRELALECDYTYEATCQERFKQLVETEPALAGGHFHVPGVVRQLCSQRVMASEWVHGVPIDKVCALPQVRGCEGGWVHVYGAWCDLQASKRAGQEAKDSVF